MKYFLYTFIVFVISSSYVYCSDIVVSYRNKSNVIRIEENIQSNDYELITKVDYYIYNNISYNNYNLRIYNNTTNSNKNVTLNLFDTIDRYNAKVGNITNSYIEAISNYYSVLSDIGLTGAITGGITAGLSSGYNRFMETGVIDLGNTMRATSIMTASSLIGVQTGGYAIDLIVTPVISNVVVNSMLVSTAGGMATGFLYAVGSYFTGSIDRHEMRTIAVKSSVGSSASAGISAIFGVGVGVSSFSVGTLILPTLISLSVVYTVDKLFDAIDKQEEIDKLDGLLVEIAK